MENEKRQVTFRVLGTKEEYDTVFEEIYNLAKDLSPEEIISHIQSRISMAVLWGMPLKKEALETFPMHRIRVVSPDNIDETDPASFYYPPDPSMVKLGRANLVGQQVFYASGDNHTPFHELAHDIKVGESIVYYSQWAMRDCPDEVYMRSFFMGIEESEDNDYASIMAKGLNEQVEEWLQMFEDKPRELFRYCQQRYNALFRIKGSEGYHISSAIAHDTFNLALKHGVNLPIITYPAVSKNNRAVNFAIRKDFADKHLYLKQVDKVLVTKLEDKSVAYKPLERGVLKDGKIEWRTLEVKPEIDYNNVWICFEQTARPLKEGEGITTCCTKHATTVEEFLNKNKIIPKNLIRVIEEVPEGLEVGHAVRTKKYEVIAPTHGNVFVDSDVSNAGLIKYLKFGVTYTIGYCSAS